MSVGPCEQSRFDHSGIQKDASGVEGLLMPCQAVDDVAAARQLAEHLLELANRSVAVIMSDPTHASSAARLVVAADQTIEALRWGDADPSHGV